MTRTCETPNLPTRPRAIEPLPVLISIPRISTPVRPSRLRPRGRRRLRREVRAAGYALLALLPASMAFVAFGGERLPTLAVGLTVEHRGDPAGTGPGRVSVISLEPLEPVVTVVRPRRERDRERDAPVVLPGYLLPADTAEESSHGGH